MLQAPPRPRPPSHRKKPRFGFRRLMALLLVATIGALVWRTGVVDSLFGGDETPTAAKGPAPTSEAQ